MFEMVGIQRKIWTIGGSVGMTFAPEIIEALKLKHGDVIVQDVKGRKLIISKKK